MKQIASGAEAIIYLDEGRIIKKRIKKNYRISEIDETLRKSRTKREAKILQKLQIPGPRLLKSDDKETIEMEFVKGELVKDILDTHISIAKEIGKTLSVLHDQNIIHGDLTTSNMIFNNKIFFIDFGLSFSSYKIEDKAVDIHLFRQALESKHHKVFEKAYKLFLQGYRPKGRIDIMQRLKIVEARGRNK